MRRGLVCVVAAAVMVFASAAMCQGAGMEDVERLLPANTFLYGGVEKLGPTFEKVAKVIQANVPFFGERPLVEQALREMARDMHLGDIRTPEAFAAATGLDPEGSAGIAWVLADPSVSFESSLTENVLIALPIKDPAPMEALLAKHVLRGIVGESERACRRTLERIRRAKQRYLRLNKDAAGPITWEQLATANPGLKKLRCPAGGEFKIGGPGEAPTSSVLERGGLRRPDGPVTRDTLGVRQVGDVTLVGGRAKGTGYALTKTHIIVSNNMNVLEDAVAAASAKDVAAEAGLAPASAAKLAAPTPGPAAGDGRGYWQSKFLFDLGKEELERWGQRRSPVAAKRLIALIDAGGALTADATLKTPEAGGAVLDVAATWHIEENAVTKDWLATPPAELAAFKLLPASALFAVGTNLGRATLSVIADIAMLEEPAVAAATKLAMAACDGDGAFAFTRGIIEDEVPNMVIIMRVGNRAVMDGAIEIWMAMMAKELRAEKGVERTQMGDVTVRSLAGRRDFSLHVAYVGQFAVACTNLEDLKEILAIHNGDGKALVGSAKYRKLGAEPGPLNAVMFVDLPTLINEIASGEHQSRILRANRTCRRNIERLEKMALQVKKDKGQFPATPQQLRDARKGYVPTHCWMPGENVQYLLDANTGKVTCPTHGTLADFRPARADAPRRRDEEELVFSAFGTSILRLRLEGGTIKAQGRLIPVPQRRTDRGAF